MKRIRKYIGAVFLSTMLFGATFYYFKFQETDYNSLMRQAYKRKDDFSYITVFDGVYEVSIPDSVANLEGPGVDSDNNGIRDEIDIWINRMSNSFNERMAMRQYAKVQMEFMNACYEKQSPEESKESDALEKSWLCLEMISYYERKGKSFGVPMLDLLIANTDSRKSCYRAKKERQFNKLVTLDLLESNCQFPVHNPKGIVEVSDIYKKSIQ